jgi:putative heme-binding domain-containing protein
MINAAFRMVAPRNSNRRARLAFAAGQLCLFGILAVLLTGCSKTQAAYELRVDPRFSVELWASEPLLDGPVAMTFDAGGKAFVFESPVFPPEPGSVPRVKELVDTNGDGKPDRAAPAPGPTAYPGTDESAAPDGTVFATAALSHVQAGGRSISDHGKSAFVFPITENPVYPVLAPADRSCSSTGIAFYSNHSFKGFERALLIAEPVHNLVHCDLVLGSPLSLTAARAREDAEFLASADPQFRPVHIAVGPDNSIYVVDYHAALASPSQILEVGIKPDRPAFRAQGKGRIYRIIPKSAATAPESPIPGGVAEPARSLPPPPDGPPPLTPLPPDAAGLQAVISDPTVVDTHQAMAVRALGSLPGDGPAVFLLSRWRSMTSLPRAEAVEAIFREPGRIRLFLDQLEKEMIPLWCFDEEHRVRLLKNPDSGLAARTRKLLEAHRPDADPVIRKYESALEKKGNREAGEQVYRKLCGRCHTFKGGSNYGPDLWSVSSFPPKKILINILRPSESMVPGREMYMIDLKGGGNVDGVIGSQNDTSVFVLHDESRQETILHQDIQRVLLSDASAMPVDLASQISIQDMADLIRFLTTR